MINRGKRNQALIQQFDWTLFILTIVTSIFGIFAIYSATHSLGSISKVAMQTVCFFLGIGIMVFLTLFDYEQFEVLTKFIYALCVALLVLVLIIGTMGEWGARSWIRIGPIGIQPAEIVKVGFIITFAYSLQKIGDNINHPINVLKLLAHLGILVGLILMQPDAGSAMVFIFIFMCMIFVAGLSLRYIIPTLILGAGSLPIMYFFVLSPYQQKRIQVFFSPELDPLGSGYNVIQSKIAVGSGQFFGKGYLQGIQNQMGHLPTKYTDFIFSTISEEFGIIGAMVVVLLLFLIIYRCIKIGQNAQTQFGRYICTGVSAMLLFHTFENIGMCMGLMPVTGIPLPFISYGGTSLMTNMIAIGLVMSVSYRSRDSMFCA